MACQRVSRASLPSNWSRRVSGPVNQCGHPDRYEALEDNTQREKAKIIGNGTGNLHGAHHRDVTKMGSSSTSVMSMMMATCTATTRAQITPSSRAITRSRSCTRAAPPERSPKSCWRPPGMVPVNSSRATGICLFACHERMKTCSNRIVLESWEAPTTTLRTIG